MSSIIVFIFELQLKDLCCGKVSVTKCILVFCNFATSKIKWQNVAHFWIYSTIVDSLSFYVTLFVIFTLFFHFCSLSDNSQNMWKCVTTLCGVLKCVQLHFSQNRPWRLNNTNRQCTVSFGWFHSCLHCLPFHLVCFSVALLLVDLILLAVRLWNGKYVA